MQIDIPKGTPIREVLKIVKGASKFEWINGVVRVWY